MIYVHVCKKSMVAYADTCHHIACKGSDCFEGHQVTVQLTAAWPSPEREVAVSRGLDSALRASKIAPDLWDRGLRKKAPQNKQPTRHCFLASDFFFW